MQELNVVLIWPTQLAGIPSVSSPPDIEPVSVSVRTPPNSKSFGARYAVSRVATALMSWADYVRMGLPSRCGVERNRVSNAMYRVFHAFESVMRRPKHM